MPELLQWMDANFALVFLLFVVLLFGRIAFDARRRRRIGPLHPPIERSQVVFSEKYVSGFSDKNFVTRMGGARNALEVTVLKDAVLIEPMALLKWVLPMGFDDLEHYILRRELHSVEPSTTMLGRRLVRITFTVGDGSSRTLQLQFRNHDGFLAALGS